MQTTHKSRTPPTAARPGRTASLPALPADGLAFALLRSAEVMHQVIAGSNLHVALAACWQRHAPLPAQRGAIQDLAYGSLRQFGRGDFLLSQLLRTPLDDTGDKPLLHTLLLVALYRIESRPADVHTTVDQAVEAVARIGRGQFKALANAVLRNRLRQDSALLAACAENQVARQQHPLWWINKLHLAYPAQWQDILGAGNGHPPMSLRINRRHTDAASYCAELQAVGIAAIVLDDHALLLERPVAVERLPGFFAGHVSVQDWGAQQAARLLDVQDGQRVLDACAAPGGKTTHILELADVELLALEVDATRAVRIEDNLQRLGLRARVQVADCRQIGHGIPAQNSGLFERILADVPCSASGVVRRHPDIKWLRREKDIAGFSRVQREILDALWQALAPGGKMLYCTCSLFPQENAAQIDAFLHRHADARCLPLAQRPAATDSARLATHDADPRFLQLIPQAKHDGFFYALLQKQA
ncbi:MAG: 16S rRNA (cytosine(967)-C(5))-methyltransferase RsmB [Sterolibacterium sp.]|nr:16S rRNA (cytosine(967)-C(5))-methyltransferase RsmB [Sterolibacterium sp.]